MACCPSWRESGRSLPRQTAPGWRAWRLAGAAAVLAVVGALQGCASLDAWERRKVYRPTAVDSAEWQRLLALRPDVRAFAVPSEVEGQQLQVLQVPARPGQTSAVRILYLHGTFRHAYQNLAKAEPMRRAGMDVLMPDYRGWGVSFPLLPSEDSIHADAWAAWQALQGEKQPDGSPVRWVIYGHSMGSAVAVRLASRLRSANNTCALVLESAFTSFPDVADAGAGWLGRLLSLLGSQRMASIQYIDQVSLPVWFLHGSLDKTVPLAVGRRLFERALEPRRWYEWPLGHSNLQTDPTGRYDQVWRDIAARCAGP